MSTRRDQDPDVGLQPRQYDRIWQNVRGQYSAVVNAGSLRLEPAFSRNRSIARLHLFALQPAFQLADLPVLCGDSFADARIDGRVLYPQERINQLECGQIIYCNRCFNANTRIFEKKVGLLALAAPKPRPYIRQDQTIRRLLDLFHGNLARVPKRVRAAQTA